MGGVPPMLGTGPVDASPAAAALRGEPRPASQSGGLPEPADAPEP
jgi:hypothetical protein